MNLRSAMRRFTIASALSVLGLSLAVGLVSTAGPANAETPNASVHQWGMETSAMRVVSGLPSDIVAVQAANWGGMALDAGGHVWDWGRGQYGELGNGTTMTSLNTAVEAQGPANVVSIGEGDDYAAAVDNFGNLWVWGDNLDGTLCLNHESSVDSPVRISGLGAVAVAGGGAHLLILLANGTVDACGSNQYGQLGNGTTTSSPEPVAVRGLTNVVAISAGNTFSGALKANGSVWTWGRNTFGQLGIGTRTNEDVPQKVSLPAPATQVYEGGDYPYDGHMVALLTNKEMLAWGDDTWGQLGNGVSGQSFTTPQRVDVPSQVTFASVAAGGRDTFAIDTAGGLWAWGYSGAGDLGITNEKGTAVVQPIRTGSGFSLVSATAVEGIGLSSGS